MVVGGTLVDFTEDAYTWETTCSLLASTARGPWAVGFHVLFCVAGGNGGLKCLRVGIAWDGGMEEEDAYVMKLMSEVVGWLCVVYCYVRMGLDLPLAEVGTSTWDSLINMACG